jgi:hypothetical protein
VFSDDKEQDPDLLSMLKNDYEQVKVEAGLLGMAVSLSWFAYYMLVRVNVLRNNTFITILLSGMLIYGLVAVLAIFNYAMYDVCVSKEKMILFYFLFTSCCLIMSLCLAFYASHMAVEAYKFVHNCEVVAEQSQMKQMEMFRNRVAHFLEQGFVN